MTIEQMAAEINVDAENLNWWIKSVAAYVADGMTMEQAVERVHMVCNAIIRECEKPEMQQSPEFKAWKRRLSDSVWESINGKEAA